MREAPGESREAGFRTRDGAPRGAPSRSFVVSAAV